ncbi:MAG: autotransporter-associated beta strand repeat-containing protein, partial [Thermoguttaceae bacterium]
VVTGGTLVAVQDTSLGAAPGSAVADQLTLDGGTLRCSRGIADVTVTDQGDWYQGIYFPTATITGGGGSGASVLVSGSVKSATVYGTTSGGWSTVPTVYFDAPDMVGGVKATGTLSSTVGGSITGSTVTNPNENCGYTSAPAVLYLEGVNDDIPNAEVWGKTFKMQVEDVILASGAGYGYTSTPTVEFSNGNATATATLTSPSMTLAATRGITLGTGGGTIETDSGFNATVAGVISGNGALTKTGAGTLTMTASNTYAGATTVSAGTLQIGDGGTTGSLSSGTISIGSGANLTFNRSSSLILGNIISGAGSLTKLNTNTLTLTGANSYTGATNVDAGILQIGAGATSGTIGSGALAVNSGATLKFNRSDAYTVDNTISGGGALIVAGGGTLTYTGASTLSGTTSISSSTLSSTTLQLGDGTTNGEYAGTILIGSTATLLFNNATTQTFNGVIGGSTGTLSKDGAGQLTLGGASTYTGTARVLAGTLQIGAGSTSGSIDAGAFAVSSGATLKFNRRDAYTVDSAISGGGALVVTGGGTLTYTGASTLSGTTSISSSTLSSTTLQLGDGTTNGAYAGTILIGSTSTLLFNNATSQTFSGVIGGSTGTLSKDGAGTLTLVGANTYTGTTRVLDGKLQLGSGGSMGSVNGNIANSALLAFDYNGDQTYGYVISGSGGLKKYGTGMLTLTGSNTFTGTTTVSAGTLQIGDGGTTGSLSAGAITVDSGATLKFNRSDSYTISNAISGSGSIYKLGAGTLTYLGGSNTCTGATTISAGTLQFGNGTTNGSVAGNIAIGSGTLLVFNNASTQNYNGTISGSGYMSKKGAGSLVFTGSMSCGSLTVSAGKLQIGNGSTSGTVNMNIANNALVTFNNDNDQTYGYVISGTGGLKKYDSGMLTLTGSNSFSGTTTVSEGTLRLSGSGSINGSGSITLDGGALMQDSSVALTRVITFTSSGTLGGTGAYTRTGANVSIGSGHLSPGDGGIGTFTMNCGTATLASDSVLDYDFGTTSGSCDSIVVNGTLVLDGTLNISCSGSLPGGDYVIFSATSIVDNGLVLGTHPSGHTYTINVTGTTVTVHAAPEPGTIVLLMIGLVGLATYAWRKKKNESLRG